MVAFVPFIFVSTVIGTAFGKSSSFGDISITEQNWNVVRLDIVGSSACPDTTRFFSSQLIPLLKKYSSRVHVNYHPFGPFKYTRCSLEDKVIECQCQHGALECQMNTLQACAMKRWPASEDHIDIVACIQRAANFNDSFTNCLTNHKVSLDTDSIRRCANSQQGKRLLADHGVKASQLADDIYWVPWISIDGLRIPSAEKHLEAVLCNQYFEPPPTECQNLGV